MATQPQGGRTIRVRGEDIPISVSLAATHVDPVLVVNNDQVLVRAVVAGEVVDREAGLEGSVADGALTVRPGRVVARGRYSSTRGIRGWQDVAPEPEP